MVLRCQKIDTMRVPCGGYTYICMKKYTDRIFQLLTTWVTHINITDSDIFATLKNIFILGGLTKVVKSDIIMYNIYMNTYKCFNK